ncbi:hypothetical protein HG535_0G04400 [Zygotorulaspora mrakii]|uniref:Genetic interactor of prohibitin 5, mitochondrial n=1 Tax=Zygotorulaspora mrakii TaxID=42260 RepID=A0A7H9B7H4_ZYGMR|nr:uncharacterized protein HG535_0G04400 [Zygotorulaspora mrakii]QLG74557.1 hypothetical protein HG535_0G04400 [Zygotorulaspora mrakii]
MKIITQAITGKEKLLPFLINSLDRLPLHRETLSLLESRLKDDKTNRDMLVSMSDLVLQYERAAHRSIGSEKKKALESLIHHVYFIWNNPLPDHLQKFRKNYRDMIMFWPYERHRSLLNMENPKKLSLRYRWSDNNENVLAMMRYEKNPWMTYCKQDAQPEGADLTQAFAESERDPVNVPNKNGPVIDRDNLFFSIFTHYLFLKSNARLCKNGKNLPIPIVEIPLRPLGQDVAVSRIQNIFKRKVAQIWKILAVENPVLSVTNEHALYRIVSETVNRPLRRLYQKACKRAYVIDQSEQDSCQDIEKHRPKFKASNLLLKKI